mmetsp:Transcript_6173/g.15770  ORF Transcript_6173/g.15770 Transcript_6173/m.15770 type:complete len:252 (-) Transcript_6173:421-1176(-)
MSTRMNTQKTTTMKLSTPFKPIATRKRNQRRKKRMRRSLRKKKNLRNLRMKNQTTRMIPAFSAAGTKRKRTLKRNKEVICLVRVLNGVTRVLLEETRRMPTLSFKINPNRPKRVVTTAPIVGTNPRPAQAKKVTVAEAPASLRTLPTTLSRTTFMTTRLITMIQMGMIRLMILKLRAKRLKHRSRLKKCMAMNTRTRRRRKAKKNPEKKKSPEKKKMMMMKKTRTRRKRVTRTRKVRKSRPKKKAPRKRRP